jgi:hypothetical protein
VGLWCRPQTAVYSMLSRLYDALHAANCLATLHMPPVKITTAGPASTGARVEGGGLDALPLEKWRMLLLIKQAFEHTGPCFACCCSTLCPSSQCT